jgi:hypothetical protein
VIGPDHSGELHGVPFITIDVDSGIDDAGDAVRLRPEPVAGELPQPGARPVAWCHRPGAVLREPKAMRGEMAVDGLPSCSFMTDPE